MMGICVDYFIRINYVLHQDSTYELMNSKTKIFFIRFPLILPNIYFLLIIKSTYLVISYGCIVIEMTVLFFILYL